MRPVPCDPRATDRIVSPPCIIPAKGDFCMYRGDGRRGFILTLALCVRRAFAGMHAPPGGCSLGAALVECARRTNEAEPGAGIFRRAPAYPIRQILARLKPVAT